MSETRPRPAWMLAYEDAYGRVTGRAAHVVATDTDEYRMTVNGFPTRCVYTRAEIEELTRSLEERCHA